MRTLSDADINLEIERNLQELYREAARRAALPLVEDESLSYVLSRPSRWPETLFCARLDAANAAGRVAEVARRARLGELPQSWKVGPLSSPPGLAELLRANGYALAFANVDMACELGLVAERPPARPGVETHRVEDGRALDEWLRVVAIGLWRYEPAELPALSVVFGPLLAGGRFRAFVTMCDGVPAAAAATFRTNGSIGLYHVATLPELRSRGLGREVVSAALHDERTRGAGLAILHASEMGEPLYRKLGFRPYGTLETYRLPEE